MRKKLLPLFLAVVMVLSLIPTFALEAQAVSLNESYNTGTGNRGGGGGALISDTFTSAYVRNKGASAGGNGTPCNLELVVTAKAMSSAFDYYAMVMKATDYAAKYPNGPRTGGLDMGTYYGQTGLSSINHYAMARKKVASSTAGQKIVLDFVAPSAGNHDTLGLGGTVLPMSMPMASISGDNYFDEYVLVVFSENREVNDNYYVDHFYVDSEGYVRTPSYGVRYNENNPTNTYGTGTVGNMPTNANSSNNRTFIQRAAWSDSALGTGAPGAMTLSATVPTRTGYEFVGWTDKALNPLAEGATVPANGAQVTSGTTTATFYTSSGTYAQPGTLNQIYNLYALWRTVPVKFSHANGPNYTVTQEGGVWVMTWTGKLPQVNVSFNSTNLLYEKPGTTGEPAGNKTFQIVTKEDGTVKGSTVTNAYNQSFANHYGLIVKQVDVRKWSITGTPGKHSDGKVVTLELTVTDTSNNTSDTITVKFSEVKKGAQPIPTSDVNTGLQSQVETLAEGDQDGQIYGFYSAGATKDTATEYTENDTGYRDKVDGTNTNMGTGTMTEYYLSKGMVFEYRPKTVENAAVDYTDLYNEGWREVPFPESWYTEVQKTSLLASMAAGATTYVKSTLKSYNTTTKVGSANTANPVTVTAWPDAYGSITFEDGLPVIHGLKADDVYEVRFCANANFSASEAREITIGGAAGGGGSSAGLLFNLMRGSVWQIPKPALQNVTTISVTMGEGGTATITNVKEAEAAADDGDTPTSVTITGAETKTLTVLTQPVTVTVTPATGFETYTAAVTVDGTAATLTDNALTLPTQNATGTLALNISFTAPETPPEPTAHSAVTVETDVTDTLFAASPTGTLPDGSALGLGEGETLQLRDPEGVPVDSITFYVSATGSVLSPGAIDTYVCTLNEQKTSLVWTKNDAAVNSIPLNNAFLSLAAQFGGKADPSAFLAVSTTDWDGSPLGVFIFAKDSNPATQKANAEEALASFKAGIADKLTSHPGYDFLTLVKDEDEIPTSYGTRVVSNAFGELTELALDPEDELDFATLTDSTSAKAAYTTNADLNDGMDQPTAPLQAAARNYQSKIVGYGKFGTTPNFSLTIEVKRGNVPRLTSPWLIVRSQISGVSTYSRYALTGADSETVTIALYAASGASGLTGVELVEWTVIDDYGDSNWVNIYSTGSRTVVADCQSTASFTTRDVGTSRNQRVWDAGTYPLEGMVAQVYEQLLARDADGTAMSMSAANLRTMGIIPSTANTTNLQNSTFNNWVTLGRPELTYDILNQIGSVASVTP